ncbi:MAG: prephenate dehydrogenase [Bulleidia sp.]
MIDNSTVFAIVGLGVLGGSYAQVLSEKGYHVIGIDIDSDTVDYALEKHWIEEGGSDPSLVKTADIVVCALYPHVFVNWIEQNASLLKKGCLLTDVTGVKEKIIAEINARLPEYVEFIACHPMAGRESRGIHFADSSRFHNANFIIVPTENNSEEAVSTAHQLAEILGFTKISKLSAEEHDRMIGFLSQLTHVMAVSLMNVSDNTHLAEYTGDSFRDLTRIAKINEDMWPELFILNKDNLIREIHAFTDEMLAFAKLIENEDVDTMKEKMIQSTERRKKFDR